jgi:tetratricopeptide (TPR) repeat protein
MIVLWMVVTLLVASAALASSWRVTGAKVHIRQEEYPAAEKLLEEEIAESPDNAEAYAYLGKAYVLQDKFMEAAEAWAKAEELYAADNKDKKIKEILQDRQYYWATALNKGAQYISRAFDEEYVRPEGETVEMDLDRAEEALVATYHIFSPHPKTLYSLGRLYEVTARVYGERDAEETVSVVDYDLESGARAEREMTAGEYVEDQEKKALETYEKAVELKQADMAGDNWDEKVGLNEYIKSLGNVALRLKMFDRALATIDPLLAETPDDVTLLEAKAVILENLGKVDEAIETYRTMAGYMEPDNYKAQILFRIGALYLRKEYEGRDPKKAVEVLEEALAINPEDHRVLMHLGQAYSEIGEYAKGKEYFEKGQKLYEESLGGGGGE